MLGLGSVGASIVLAALALSQSGTASAPASAPAPWGESVSDTRFELGARLRELERAWLECRDRKVRGRAIPMIQGAVTQFFLGRTGGVAQSIGDGTRTLRGQEETAAVRLADSFSLRIPEAIVDVGHITITVVAAPLFDVDAGEVPLSLEATIPGRDPVLIPLDAEGVRIPVELPAAPEGDGIATLRILGPSGELARRAVPVARIARFEERLRALAARAAALEPRIGGVEGATLEARRTLLERASRARPETEIALAALLAETEEGLARLEKGEPWLATLRGDVRLAFQRKPKTAGSASAAGASARRPPPVPARALLLGPEARVVVVALHGAGGSENLFFDAYGNGLLARMCRERGWALLAPNVHAAGTRLGDAIDALAPVVAPKAERCFLVGHSMGAMAAIELLRAPRSARPQTRFAGAALLSGGVLGDVGPLASMPIFLAAGTRDFGRGMTESLAARLRAQGGKPELALYEAEHLLVVPDALPDVVRRFEDLAR